MRRLRTGEDCPLYSKDNGDDGAAKVLESLQREDQLLVQRLADSMGRCVLALGESGRASAEGRAYRRRLEAARRVLEG